MYEPTLTPAAVRRVRESSRGGVDYDVLPAWARAALREYIERGIRPPGGGVLLAALENNLRDFVLKLRVRCQSDHDFGEQCVAVARFLQNEMPAVAWGSRERVAAWLAVR